MAQSTLYLHGEASLTETIIGMAQDFVGSGNAALLVPEGQFGTRLQGGKDHAASRYVYTQASDLARALYPAGDLPLLELAKEEGQEVEPKHFVPVLPVILLNGASSIATGFATTVPCFALEDLLACARACCDAAETLASVVLPELRVSWRGFSGDVAMDEAKKSVRTRGAWTREGTKVCVSELPIGRWTETALADWRAKLDKENGGGAGGLRRVVNRSTDSLVSIDLEFETEVSDEQLVSGLKLQTYVSWNNMWLFDAEGKLRRFEAFRDIVLEHAGARLALFARRRAHELLGAEAQLEAQEQRARFIGLVLSGEVRITGLPRAELDADLKARGFNPENLRGLTVDAFCAEERARLTSAVEELRRAAAALREKTPAGLWREALSIVERAHEGYALSWEARHSDAPQQKHSAKRKKRG